MTYVSKKSVPFLILHGQQDQVVPVKDSEVLYEALNQAGVDADLVDADLYELETAGHMDVQFMQPAVFKLILEFLKKHLN